MKILIIFISSIFVLNLSATVINIPADYPTIQQGINVTVYGDTVLVQPGIYIETINYYRQRNSNVFSCLLDASKAFDKVHFGKLFKMLMKRKLPAVITRYLLDSYMRQELCVLWNSHKSRYFNVSNGVKQGGVLSPILFTVYIDDLLSLLKAAKLGCHVNHTYVGALCYADDITLLSPSLRALNNMITICELFAKKYYITFNIKKTVCIKFGSDVNIDEGAYMYGKRLEWSDTVKHLGNIVNKDLDDLDDCKLKGGVFIGSVNKLLGNFGKLQPNIVYNLFNSYCCSFYGSQLWNPNSPGFRKCCINWNKATRRILCLPSRTHTWMLGPLSDQLHISTQLYIRSVKFIVCLLRSKNEIVHCIMNNAVSNAMSPLGNKIAFFRYKYDIDIFHDMNTNIAKIVSSTKLDLYCQARVDNIKTILCINNGICKIDGFTRNDLNDMLDYIATC